MRHYLKILFLLSLLLLQNEISAQKLTFNYITVKNGLPQNTVSSIIKDKYGFMWFGTWNGLCRYDGYTFKVYYTNPNDNSSISNNRIHYLFKDNKGTLWITTFNTTVCRYNYETDNFTRFNASELPKSLKDSTDRRRNLATLKNFAQMFKQPMGNFLPPPNNEHLTFQTKTNLEGGLSDNNIYSAYRDNNGLLWLGTVNGGVNWTDLNAKKFTKFSLPIVSENAKSLPVTAVLTDESGIWLGTPENGLAYANREGKIIERFAIGPSGDNVRSIFKDSFNDVWIGYRSGLDKYDAKTNSFITYFHDKPGIQASSRRFSAIAEDPVNHSMWFGTSKGIVRRDRRTNTFEKQQLKQYFDNSSVVCLFFDSKNNLWIGTSYNGVIQLKRDQKSNSWTDTVVFNTKTSKAKLPDQRVYTIAEDKTGTIWAGTTNGLCKINPTSGKIKVYTKNQGLVDQYIAKIIVDKTGNLWFSHKKGVSKLETKSDVIRNYSISESALGYEGLDGSGYTDHITGKIYFGGIDGYLSFLPNEIIDNSYLPTPILTELQVLNKPVGVQQAHNGEVILTKPLYLTKKITLRNSDRSFSIEFSALHYAAPERNQYVYILEGFDKDWIHTDASKRTATYANLPAGNYIFKVKASNSDGVWQDKPTIIQISILPPWWKTWWAYAIYFIFLLTIIYLTYRYIKTQHKHDQQLLIERLKSEKALEMDRLKSNFFTHISHEFRTPLTLIIDPLESLLAGKLPSEKLNGYYAIMHRNARRLLRLINQFLDFKKLESGKFHLHVTQQDIVAFIRNTIAAFELRAQQKEINFTFETELQHLAFNFDADVVDKIVFNLLSNAFKFTPLRGEIIVSLSAGSNETINISVTDNGIGIPHHLLDNIFDPFYQVNSVENENKGGTGVGLALIKELVLRHNGNIDVYSEPNVKTCFFVSLNKLSDPVSAISQSDEQAKNNTTDFILDENLSSKNPQASTDKPIVLIVEDNLDVRNYLIINLNEEYQIIEADNGNDGMEKALESLPDLIISDVMMPGLNGIQLCEKLKTNEKTSHIPIILLTARQSDEHQTLGYETGADAYIGKPFNSALLLVRIKNLIGSRKKLRELFNRSTGFNTRVVASYPIDQAFMEKTTKLIQEQMANEDFNVEWMATQLFLSRTQLYRKIKALTNQSVHDFVTTIRLNRAAELLLENQHQVSEVAFLVGYGDSTSFSRSFQKQFGQTPKKYSQQGR